ncbi:MAG: KH domain-containing protein [Akkermansiaceae bacterium]|jgi:predicted RNA-binding protein YlqC (UPF0109 family)|nr:KH domain-containing protein [Akkermansiaceae bacterium]
MSKFSEFSRSLRELGSVRVNDWDFRGLMQRDIREIDVTESLRKLGNLRVLDWDFADALPAVHKLAYQEVHLGEWVRKAANYKVIDWSDSDEESSGTASPDLEDLSRKLRAFIHFLTVAMVDKPEHATIRVRLWEPDRLLIRLVVSDEDIMQVIGRDGETASAMRRMIQATGELRGAKVRLEVMTHNEELALRQKGQDFLTQGPSQPQPSKA